MGKGAWVAYGAVHDDYESVAVVAAGLAAPMAVAHSLVVCQSRVGCVRTGDFVYRKDRLAFELIGPVATSTAAFYHVVEILVSLNAKVVEKADSLFLSLTAGGIVEGKAGFFVLRFRVLCGV